MLKSLEQDWHALDHIIIIIVIYIFLWEQTLSNFPEQPLKHLKRL